MLSVYNNLLDTGWKLREIDSMNMLEYFEVRLWKAQKEHKKKLPKRVCIDQAWANLRP